MKASDVMTQPVIAVNHDATLHDAIRLMLKHRISGMPVVDRDGKPVGMITEGDLLRRIETGTERKRSRWIAFLMGPGKMADEYIHTHSRRVRELMTEQLISSTPDTPLEEVVSLMEKHHIKRIPVVDGDRLAGMVTRANLMQALLHYSSGLVAPTPPDADIRQRVLDALKETLWGDKGYMTVMVKNGVVHLHGLVTNVKERDALRVAAENVAGVKAVMNHVEWCDLASGTVLPFPEERVEAPPT